MAETLYVVATPIGNLADITSRALRVLQEVALIAAEDTRTTRKLLSHYNIHTPLLSYTQHNSKTRIPRLLDTLHSSDVALVSEAGTPTISDPGAELVRAAAEQGISVCPVPGPSVIPTALAVAGLPADQYTFSGFLPRRQGERRRRLQSLKAYPWSLVAFEAPHRLRAMLEDTLEVMGDRKVVVCRELTKVHEEIFRGTLSTALAHFAKPRGEFTLVIAGLSAEEQVAAVSDKVLLEALADLRKQGVSPSEAASQVAHRHGIPRRRVYRLSLEQSQ